MESVNKMLKKNNVFNKNIFNKNIFNKNIFNKNIFNKYNLEILLISIVLIVSIGLVVYFVITDKSSVIKSPIQVKIQDNVEEEQELVQLASSSKKEILLFYASWCGHSQKFLPIWEKLQQKFSDSCNFITIDVDNDEKGLANDFKIKGMPSIFVGCNNTYTEYAGSRSFESLVAFINEYTCA